jgi:L-cysteine:1D-myo-inositol 2-amino-2-deoxy-alpha-D-glucopyranoside ligase
MRLYNPLSQQTEPFSPSGDAVTIYVCGVTPYDTTHLGHAFTYAAFDVLIRYLEFSGYRVRYAQNVTDIDDDILRKAAEVGEDWRTLGDRWTAHFIRDMRALNVRPPDYFPRATEVIPGMIGVVERLLDRGVAYEASGSVYFHVDSWPEFGKLSGIPRDQMLPIANERGNRPDDPNKRDPLDFVLWQAQAPGEPAWDSPWGKGRPGWHIECSTMSEQYLGGTLDVHGGGADLVFPHHESEIAQAEAATGRKPFVRYWLHTAMVRHEGEKMSKSLGNLVMVRDLLETWSPDGLRVYMASHHYRESWSYDLDELAHGERLAQKLREAVAVASGTGVALDVSATTDAFSGAMADDLNTPLAAAALERLADDVLDAAGVGGDVSRAQDGLRAMGRVFGLCIDAEGPEPRVVAGWTNHLQRFVRDEEVQ